jgi:hypothetical protein
MLAKKAQSTNSCRLRTDQQLETALVFLENYAIFLRTVSDKISEPVAKETFALISADVDSLYNRLSSYHRRRSAQTSLDQDYPISPVRYKLWQALRKHYIFQKPGIGKAFALRVVSTSEAADKALQYSLLGIACFRIFDKATSTTFQKLASTSETRFAAFATQLSPLTAN